MLDAGELKHRIKLFKPTYSSNKSGESTISWTHVNTVWGKVIPLSHKVKTEYRQAKLFATTQIRIRYIKDFDETYRICIDGKFYAIEGIVDFENKKEDLTISLVRISNLDA